MRMTVPVVANRSELFSPSLVVVRESLGRNLAKMIEIAGDTARLRPHCKTHKMPEITKIELAAGIAKHKCATLAEAEMLADAGAKDIFLAYNLVGPNIGRAVRFLDRYPDVALSVTADDVSMIRDLSSAVQSRPGRLIGVLLDLDTGLHRTGVSDPQRAAELYACLVDAPGIVPGGFHLYDGHNHQTPWEERKAAVLAGWEQARRLRDEITARGWPVDRIVCGGTGSFPVFAELDDPAIELSPGTCVFHDAGYGTAFPEMDFEPALWVLTRVVSRPTSQRLTLDVGTKAVASDPPKGQRIFFPELPEAVQVLHNEEHLVLETPDAHRYQPGDLLWGIPRHVCPTVALHKSAHVAENGMVRDHWAIVARDRQITI